MATINLTKLNARIVESGMSKTFIAKKLGITREGFYKKLNGKSEFKASELYKLIDILHLSEDESRIIFFGN